MTLDIDSIVWLPRQALIDLHARSIAQFGGASGIRDEGPIDAALARPQQMIAYGGADNLFALAAALGFSIVKNRHPFVDGNKRAGFFSMFVFLRLNGRYLDAPEREATAMIFSVASGDRSEAELTEFLKTNSVQL
jgi:death on curing protein